jgi:DNA-binding HxlR family transcriptional regulator
MTDAVNLCPRFHIAVELIGGRWTGAIISRLLAGRSRYNELRTAIPDISDRMLSERLRALECEGLLTRHVVPESPVRVVPQGGRACARPLRRQWRKANEARQSRKAPVGSMTLQKLNTMTTQVVTD